MWQDLCNTVVEIMIILSELNHVEPILALSTKALQVLGKSRAAFTANSLIYVWETGPQSLNSPSPPRCICLAPLNWCNSFPPLTEMETK